MMKKAVIKENQHLWDRLIWLGDRIGDGDLEPSELREYNRDYKRLMKILLPEVKEDLKRQRQCRNKTIDEVVQKHLSGDGDCGKCSSKLNQSRSGSFVVVCSNIECKTKYKLKRARKGKIQ